MRWKFLFMELFATAFQDSACLAVWQAAEAETEEDVPNRAEDFTGQK